MKNWYIVQSHSSFENKVAGLIKEEAEKAKISEKFEEIVVPTHDVTEVKRGKRVQRKKKYFPGYVLIKSEMDNNIYHMIKGIKRVSGFLGSKGIPVPVSDKDKRCECGEIKEVIRYETTSRIDFQPATFSVEEERREVVVCKNKCNNSILTADLPLRLLPGVNITKSLLAHIIVSKFDDRQPLYHLEKKFYSRYGLDI